MSAGSGSSGVKILNRKHELLKQINICFNKGEKTYRSHRLDKEFGFIILQEFFEDVKEWRIIRMGNYYFGYEKIRVDKFHSGSGEFGYGMPPEPLLDYVKKITENFGFLYVDIDIFITPDFEFYVNEIQPYFGQKDDRELLRINGVSGRLSYDNSIWVFEPGEYCKNNFSNLRITEFLKSVN
jgi:glutathione synthase/RimK-type ligase-like ATP-grasp enzyme